MKIPAPPSLSTQAEATSSKRGKHAAGSARHPAVHPSGKKGTTTNLTQVIKQSPRLAAARSNQSLANNSTRNQQAAQLQKMANQRSTASSQAVAQLCQYDPSCPNGDPCKEHMWEEAERRHARMAATHHQKTGVKGTPKARLEKWRQQGIQEVYDGLLRGQQQDDSSSSEEDDPYGGRHVSREEREMIERGLVAEQYPPPPFHRRVHAPAPVVQQPPAPVVDNHPPAPVIPQHPPVQNHPPAPVIPQQPPVQNHPPAQAPPQNNNGGQQAGPGYLGIAYNAVRSGVSRGYNYLKSWIPPYN